MLCAFLALALNVGHLFSVRGELQNASDAGALAGAIELDGRTAKFGAARAVAASYAAEHFTDSGTGVVAESVELGQWATPSEAPSCDQRGDASPDGHRFCFVDDAAFASGLRVNAVRVVTARTGAAGSAGGGGVELFAGGIIAPNDADGRSTVRAAAVAVSGGPCDQGCPTLPIVLRAGCLRQAGGLRCNPPATYFVGLNPAPRDSAGLTGLDQGTATSPPPPTNSPAVCDVVTRPPGCSANLSTGVPISTSNGNNWTSNCTAGCTYKKPADPTANGWEQTKNATICEALRSKIDRDCDGQIDATPVIAQVPVVVYPGEDEDSCPENAQYNGTAIVVGFATIQLVSARCDKDSPSSSVSALCDAKMADASYSADMCMAFQFLCEQRDDEVANVGCGWFGTSPLQPVLVR
ncbi:conserved hypothetical protein [Anaeromyxobacter dehalogenans 2CP-1]|uniref:Putative Flp pilus-assembly TadG-like N-terminal domain-containing protein n=2 Tax=Anaeromyxobacter dehalogenans TaxID=161493 RepID=B8JFH2_ANAD2|nr:conserved hypothetical protein [Anaeromyxobacter dehalogenans 2CP-1]